MRLHLLTLTLLGTASLAHAGLLVDTAGGTVLSSFADDASFGPRNLGFSFHFFGTSYTQTFVSSNGFVSFGSGSLAFGDSAFPLVFSAPMAAPFWDDLAIGPGNLVENTGATYYAATWNGIYTLSGHSPLTAQVVLFGAPTVLNGFTFHGDDIAFAYGPIGAAGPPLDATVGLNAADGTGFALLPGTSGGVITEATLNLLPSGSRFVLFRPLAEGIGYVTSIESAAVPEPGSWFLLLGGLAGILAFRRNLP